MLFIFLSWQVLPGITVQSFGSYLLIAFLSGFSERYFLNLLQIDPQKGETKAKQIKQVEEEKQKRASVTANDVPEKVLRDESEVSLKPTKPTHIMPTTNLPYGLYQTSGSGGSKSAYNPEDKKDEEDKGEKKLGE
ncbi:hypothetical protein BKI52_33465 [marine bacterium AO1-C]|nr:hypothetical protein BKI52_33465 [marine bacterium AO1-C]